MKSALNPLIEQIADHTGEYALLRWGAGLTPKQRRRLKRRYVDSTRAALLAFEEVSNARAIRARAVASEN